MVRFPLGYATLTAVALGVAGFAAPASLFAQVGSGGDDETPAPLQPRDVPDKLSLTQLQAMPDSDAVIVKFSEGLVVRKDGDGLSGLASAQRNVLSDAVSAVDLPMSAFERLHTVPEADLDAQRELGQQRTGKELADLNLYYRVDVPAGQTAAEVANSLNALDFIEFAEPAPAPAPSPVDIAPATPDFTGQQGYKGAAPTGINVNSLSGLAGVTGNGIKIVDIEYSWQLNHEDLEMPSSRVINVGASPVDPFNSTDHGTAVLGEMVGKANAYGVTGIVPSAQAFVAAANTTSGYNPAAAITAASNAISAGDVILIEQQFEVCGTTKFGPLEVLQSVFDATSNATAAGRIVVAAAGNGNVDLDQANCGNLFNRAARDSGAIIVGAGSSFNRSKLGFSSYGSRVDVQGWGHNVTTTGYGPLFNGNNDVRQFYTSTFNGTSSASPIVAGAVAAIQGRLDACGQPKLTPAQMRAKLVQFGSAQTNTQTGNIGPLPDVGRTLASYNCGAGPDLVISAFNRSTTQATTNQPIALTATVRNQGNAVSTPTTLRYYISNDANISNIDTPLDTDAITALAAGNTEAEDALVTLTSLGNFWLGVCVDGFAGEVDTGNNCSAGLPITVTTPVESDLVISALSASNLSPRVGQNFTINATVRNNGNRASSGTTRLQYMSSPDANITFNDAEKDFDTVPILGVGASSAQSGTVSLNRAGTRWIGACVQRPIGESAANNNCSNAVAITVRKGNTNATLATQVLALSLASPAATWGNRVRLTANVQAVAPAVGQPAGRVEFFNGNTPIGTARLNNGTAVLTTTALTLGTHQIQVRYRGTSQWKTSTSAVQSVTVGAGLGAEFRVNRTKANHQEAAAMAANSLGEFFVAWQSLEQDGSSWGIYAQRFDLDASKLGQEKRVNRTKARAQTAPSVTALENRGYVVVFEGDRADGNGYGVRGQRFARDGTKRGNPFTVNSFKTGDQRSPSVAGLTDGGFIVAWQSREQDGSGWGVYAQRFRAGGAKVGSEFKVNTHTTSQQRDPVVAGLDDGGYVIAWQSWGQDGAEYGIYAQRYRSNDSKQGGEFRVNATTADDQTDPAIAALADGGFVVGWQSMLTDGSDYGVYVQRYNADGTKFRAQLRANTETNGRQYQPALISMPDQGYIVAWTSDNQDGDRLGVFAQRYDQDNLKQDVEFQVNTTTVNDQLGPAGASLNASSAVIVWSSRKQDGSGFGIYGQRFGVP